MRCLAARPGKSWKTYFSAFCGRKTGQGHSCVVWYPARRFLTAMNCRPVPFPFGRNWWYAPDSSLDFRHHVPRSCAWILRPVPCFWKGGSHNLPQKNYHAVRFWKTKPCRAPCSLTKSCRGFARKKEPCRAPRGWNPCGRGSYSRLHGFSVVHCSPYLHLT